MENRKMTAETDKEPISLDTWRRIIALLIAYDNPESHNEEFAYELVMDRELRNAINIDDLVEVMTRNERIVAFWDMITNINIGMDINVNPDVRKEFLIRAGISERDIDGLITINDYINYQTQRTEYLQIAKSMEQNIMTIRFKCNGRNTRMAAALDVESTLQKCILDPNLESFTSIYKNKKADNILGYDLDAVSDFAARFWCRYENYMKIPFVFDAHDKCHRQALKELVTQLSKDTSNLPDDVSLHCRTDEVVGDVVSDMYIGEILIISYRTADGFCGYDINDDYDLLNDIIYNIPVLEDRLYDIVNDLRRRDWNFDYQNTWHITALEELIKDYSEDVLCIPDGVLLSVRTNQKTGNEIWDMYIGSVFIVSYELKGDDQSYTVNSNYMTVNNAINGISLLREQLYNTVYCRQFLTNREQEISNLHR